MRLRYFFHAGLPSAPINGCRIVRPANGRSDGQVSRSFVGARLGRCLDAVGVEKEVGASAEDDQAAETSCGDERGDRLRAGRPSQQYGGVEQSGDRSARGSVV